MSDAVKTAEEYVDVIGNYLFMAGIDQTTGELDLHIKDEVREFLEAESDDAKAEELTDIIVMCVRRLKLMGRDPAREINAKCRLVINRWELAVKAKEVGDTSGDLLPLTYYYECAKGALRHEVQS